MKFDKSKMNCGNCPIMQEMDVCLCDTCPDEESCENDNCKDCISLELDEYAICQENKEEGCPE